MHGQTKAWQSLKSPINR